MATLETLKQLNQTLLQRLKSTKADLDAANARITALEEENKRRSAVTTSASTAEGSNAPSPDRPFSPPRTPADSPGSTLSASSPLSTAASISSPLRPSFTPEKTRQPVLPESVAAKQSLLQTVIGAIRTIFSRLVAAFQVLTGYAHVSQSGERSPLLPVNS